MTLVHVVNTYRGGSPEEVGRLIRASATWSAQPRRSYCRVAREGYLRSGRDIGDTRDCAFVRDVIDSGEGAGDVVMLTNADSCLTVDATDVVLEAVSSRAVEGMGGWCWSPRVDVDKPMRTVLTSKQASERGTPHRGLDLVAFSWDKWLDVRDKYPDMLLGYEGWDAVMMLLLGGGISQVKPRIVYHELHNIPYWYRNRLTSVGNLYNRRVAKEWLVAAGLFKKACSIWPGVAKY